MVVVMANTSTPARVRFDTSDTALQQEGRWLLNNVTVYYSNGEKPTRVNQMVYDGALRLASDS